MAARGEGGGRGRKQAGGGCGAAAAATATAAAAARLLPRLPGGGCWNLPGAAVVLCHIVYSPTSPSPPRCGGRADGESGSERRPPEPAQRGIRAPCSGPQLRSRARRQRVRPGAGVGPGGGHPVTRPDIFFLGGLGADARVSPARGLGRVWVPRGVSN